MTQKKKEKVYLDGKEIHGFDYWLRKARRGTLGKKGRAGQSLLPSTSL
jgi:hypothetical protein